MLNISFTLLKGTIKHHICFCCCCSCIPTITGAPGWNPDILAYGKFKAGVNVYHGEFTTLDKDSSGSHLRTLKKIFTDSDTGSLDCYIEGCSKTASVGAHVYYSQEKDAAANVCFIIPTCSGDNNVHCVWKRDQAWSQGKGVPVKHDTPFTIRKVKAAAMAVKGAAGKGGGKGGPGGFKKQNGIRLSVSEFNYDASQANELCYAEMLMKGVGGDSLP